MAKSRSRPRRTQIFSSALLTAMERNSVNQVQLSAATGIAVSRINNYLHGKYRTIRPDHLEGMVKAVSRNAEEQSALIRGYILDLLPDAFQTEVQIESTHARGKAIRGGRDETSLLPGTTVAALGAMQAMSLRSAKARSRVEFFAEILSDIHSA